MATQTNPTLTYHAQQFRVRVEISREQALASNDPPPELLKRAKAKLESLHKEGKVVSFDVYETKLTKV